MAKFSKQPRTVAQTDTKRSVVGARSSPKMSPSYFRI